MEEKACGNCKNYIAHYTKYKAHLLEIGGHCALYRRKGTLLRFLNKSQKGCEKWEYAGDRENECKEHVLKTIREIKKQLTDVAYILKGEKSSNAPH